MAKLLTGGNLQAEAELVIASRKTAFNKALREYKSIWTEFLYFNMLYYELVNDY